MEKNKALEILYTASNQARLMLEDHAKCRDAYELLKLELNKIPKKTLKKNPSK